MSESALEPLVRLNESPSEKEGKSKDSIRGYTFDLLASMKALPKRKGNNRRQITVSNNTTASMKALPKRKGNQ